MGRSHRSPGAGEEQRPTSSQHQEEDAMTPDHPTQLTADELAILRVDAVLDAIVDGRPLRVEDALALMLAGPFGVDWRAGPPPRDAPPTSWEPIVLELGQAVAEALHLDPIWDDDPADYA
jgi:hypothetical protein